MATTYIRHAFRRTQIARFNASLNITNGTTLLSLPDDILLIILDILQDTQEMRQRHEVSYTCRGPLQRDLLHLSMVHRHFRALIVPRLFRKITLGRKHWQWTGDELIASLEGLRGSLLLQTVTEVNLYAICPQTWNRGPFPGTYPTRGVIDHARLAWYNISEDLYNYWLSTCEGGMQAKQSRQLETVGRLAAEILSEMPKLSTLSLEMVPIDVPTLRKTFESRSPILETVTTLKITPHLDFLVPICPNVTNIDLQHGFVPEETCILGADDRYHERRLIAWLETPTIRATKLQHFSLRTIWSQKLLYAVLDAMPGLQNLNMHGSWYLSTLSDLLLVLSQFQELQSLSLICSKNLDGYIPPAMDATMTCVSHRDDYGCHKPQAAMVMIFKALPGLRELRLGREFRAQVDRIEAGRTIIHWQMGCTDSGTSMSDINRRRVEWENAHNNPGPLTGSYALLSS